MGGGDETQARPVIVDQAGVSLPNKGDNLYVTSSDAEVADLLCEGVIEGIVSGKYTYDGNVNQTGYNKTGFAHYHATGIGEDPDNDIDLGFLQSVYWNDVPVVDANGFYNFTNINIEYVKGTPAGDLPALNSKLPASETLDLSVLRNIGERLYGISTQGGSSSTETAPSDKIVTDAAIDTVAKTYTILNKECSKIQVRIKVAGLFENIRSEDAPKTYEDSKELRKGHVASTGYGDTKARSIEYWIYFKPLFDQRFITVASDDESQEVEVKNIKWSSPRKEVIEGKIEQIYIRNTTIDLKSDYVYDPAFAGWTIKIIRITPESLTTYLRNQTYVDSIVEIYGTKLRHPYSSMVYSKFDAEFFTRVPARSYDTKLIKVHVPNNYDPIKKTYGISDAIDVNQLDREGNIDLNAIWPQSVKVKSRLRSGQVVKFEGGGKFTLTQNTPDITYPTNFYQEPNTHSLLHFDGANDATSTSDSSTYQIPISLNGSAKLSTTQEKFEPSSLYLDGTGDSATLGASDGTSFAWSNSSWGIECWVRPDSGSLSADRMIFDSAGVIYLQTNTAGKVVLRTKDAGDNQFVNITTTQALTVNTWHHVAAVRNGNDFKVYIDGTSYANTTSTDTTKTAGAASTIGEYEQGGAGLEQYFKGYIDEFRITIGEAPYTADFTPETAAFPDPYEITNYGTLNGTVHLDETGATTEGYSEGTDDDNFWDGGFKQTENWTGGNDSKPKGDAQITKEWTDNPAWGFYDLLTNPRYGLGDYIDKCQVDKWALYEIAQYCDVLVDDGYGGIEPRFTMNHIITSREEAYKVINDLSSVFRGIAYYSSGLIQPVQDAYKKPVYQFNNTNVVEGNFTYASSAKKTRHSVALVRYINKRDFYKPAVEYVEDEEAVKRYGIREIQTTALGSTSRGQARRFGIWLLASEFEETETVSFSVGQDGAYLKPGDIFQVYDQYRTPLKFGGRTNDVGGLGVAPDSVSYTNQNLPPPAVCYNPAYTNQTACENAGETWLEQDGSVTGNSVTIDNAVSFVGNQVYKFSLLTPTYSYDAAQISDMTSDEISEIRRPQIQNLYFMGAHTRTVTGAYNSDYQQEGSGICTQIYFHTGLELTDGTLVGSENQLDFDNYVITGYTNNYIQGPDGDIRESYSGGCFSGQNLIWSLEPNDPTNPEVISGNFSNYRAINIAENDDNSTYSISALAYSTGKYSSVESRMSFVSPTYSLPIHWPYIDVGGVKKTKDDYSIIKGYPQEYGKTEEEKINYMGRGFQYPTVEVRFPEAGTELTESAQGEDKRFSVDPNSTNPSNTTYLICHHAASPTEAGFGLISIANAAILFSSEGTVLYEVSTANFSKFTLDSQNRSREYFVVPGHYYDVNNPEDGDGEKIFSQYIDQTKTPPTDPITLVSYFFEALLQKDANHWFAIFALNNNVRSENAVIGLIPGTNYNGNTTPPAGIKDNQLELIDVYTQIKLISINNLTTQELESVDALKLNRLETTEPTFTWDIGDDKKTYDDQNVELFVPIPYNDYRITIREHTDSPVPSDYIYIELTGQVNPSTEGSFTFYKEYNDPNTIVSLGEYTDPNITRYDANGEITTEIDETEWFRSDTSGILLRNVPNKYPIREFDIVVEAHDSNGITSVGGDNGVGHVWNNTILPLGTEGYADTQNGFDKLGAQLAVPSGITFGYAPSIPGRQGVKKQFLISEEAYVRNYPYLATAAVYSDGTLSLSFEPSIDAAGNRVAVTSSNNGAENDLRDTFSDVAGIVYYYTTGDNTVIDVLDVENARVDYEANNEAPIFELQTANVLAAKVITVNGSSYTNLDLGFQGNARFGEGGAYENWDYDGENPQVPAILEKWVDGDDPKYKYAHIHRNYYILPGNVNPGDIRIPFPKIGLGGVQNIRLTLAFFDNLSLAQHFTSDGRPKTKTINNPKTKNTNQEIPTIFGDNSMAFSTIPQYLFEKRTSWYEGKIDGELFTQKPGHPMLLREQSVLAESEQALHYRAWFDITIDPGEGPLFTDFTRDLWCFESSYWNGNSLNFNADFDYRYENVANGWSSASLTKTLPIGWEQRTGDDLPFWWNSSGKNKTSLAFATYRGPHRPNMSDKVKKDTLHTLWGGEPKGISQPYVTSTAAVPNGPYGHGDDPPTYYSINGAKSVTTRKRKVNQLSSVLYPPKVKLKGFSKMEVSEITISPVHQFAQSCYVTLYLERELDPAFYSVDVEFYQSNMSSELVNVGENNTNVNLRDLAPADFPISSYVCEKTKTYVKFFLSPFYVGGNSTGGATASSELQKEMENGTFILHYVSQSDIYPYEKRHSWAKIPAGRFELEEARPEDDEAYGAADSSSRKDYWYITKLSSAGSDLFTNAIPPSGPVEPKNQWGQPVNPWGKGSHYWPQGPSHTIQVQNDGFGYKLIPLYYKVAGAILSATHYEIVPEGQFSTGIREGNIAFGGTSTPGHTGANSASTAAVVRYLKTKFPESTGDISDPQKLIRFAGGFNSGDEYYGKREALKYITYPNFLGNIIRMKGGILYSEEVYGK